MTLTDEQTVCPDCGHHQTYHHPTITRGDGCIGRPFTTSMSTLSEIRAGRQCGCPLEWEPTP